MKEDPRERSSAPKADLIAEKVKDYLQRQMNTKARAFDLIKAALAETSTPEEAHELLVSLQKVARLFESHILFAEEGDGEGPLRPFGSMLRRG